MSSGILEVPSWRTMPTDAEHQPPADIAITSGRLDRGNRNHGSGRMKHLRASSIGALFQLAQIFDGNRRRRRVEHRRRRSLILSASSWLVRQRDMRHVPSGARPASARAPDWRGMQQATATLLRPFAAAGRQTMDLAILQRFQRCLRSSRSTGQSKARAAPMMEILAEYRGDKDAAPVAAISTSKPAVA